MKRLLLVSLLALAGADAQERGTWLCVGPPDLVEVAGPLCELRASEGWKVQRSNAAPREAIAALPERPAAVLILGDDRLVPAERLPYHGWLAKHPKEFVSDAVFGDLDQDGVPDVPVGRIPGRGRAEIARVVDKIMAWEKRVPSPADLTIPVWSGDPGFGKIGEVMKQVALPFFLSRLRSEAPPWAGFWVQQSDPRSPFCGWPEASAANFNQRISQGSLFSAMIGHGRTDSWWIMTLPDGALRYGAADARALTAAQPAAPHIVFACKCGAFADPQVQCLGEELLFAPGGPVASIAASVDSHPLTNYYGSTALLKELDSSPVDTLGGLWVESIRRAHATREPLKEWLVALLEPFVIGKRNPVKDLKADHLLIYNLLGDPATRVFMPQALEAKVTAADGKWNWSVPKPPGLPAEAKLIVQHRAPLPSFALGLQAGDAEKANAAMDRANAALDFRTVKELGATEDWSGSIAEPGTLRLCVTGGPALLVHAARLKPHP
ncbi:C25 family cysteine peptidase [Haloferula sp. BvORR071]|uniref:C25 family cysteine peptidase n=1 Tax=Haloferula sp. BvORR071 TaxID=1396141 RepID=UPI000555E292|nr:C25 family cysteine peptidase [Haloferula sp. BvORR071]